MATFKKTLSGDSRYSITLTVNETNTDISTNSSVVSYSLTATKSSGSGYYTSSKTNTVKVIINGSTIVNKTVAYDFTGSTPKTITLASGSITIEHDSDGTKTIQCSGYFKDVENSLGSATASGSLTLTQLHQSPEFELNDITFTEINQSVIDANLPSSTYVKNLSQIQVTVSNNVVYYDNADFKKLVLYSLNNDLETFSKYVELTTNPATFTPTYSPFEDELYVRLYDNKNGSTFYENQTKIFNTIDYTNLNINASVKREGQTSGQVSISCNGTYFTGTIGNKYQGGTYKPTIKYKYWQFGSSEPATYSNTVSSSNITISNGTFTINSLNIGSTTEGDTNYFDPENAYRIKIQVSDNFTELESNELIISVGEATWTEYETYVDFKKLTIQKEPIITIESYKEFTGAVASGSNETLTYNIVKAGYTPFGIVGVYCSGTRSSYINVYAFYITENKTEAKVIFKNTNDTNPLVANDSQIRIFVAYIRG